MADFKTQIQGLTGLTTGTGMPSDNEISQFLKDSVIDVTNRCIALKPQERDNFTRESAEQTSNGFNPGTTDISAVLRESGVNGEWYPCRKENINLQYRVTDPDSLHFASKYSPVYMITQNRNVHVYPLPGSSNDGFKVLYINSVPEYTDGSALEHDDDAIKWFPEDRVHLVVISASLKSLLNALSSKSLPDDLSNIVLDNVTTSLPVYTGPTSFVPPVAPAGADISFTGLSTIRTHIPAIFTVPSLGTLTAMSLPSIPIAPTMSEKSVGTTTSPPDYILPVLTLDSLTINDLTISSAGPIAPTVSLSTVGTTSSPPGYTEPTLVLDLLTVDDLTINAVVPTAPLASLSVIGLGLTDPPDYIAPVMSLDSLTITDLTIAESAPVTPAIDSISVGALPTAPTFAKPPFALETKLTVTDLSISVAPPIPPSVDDSVDESGLVDPTYIPPVLDPPDWDDTNTWIETEEDPEMLIARVEEIKAKITEYQGRINNSTLKFNQETEIYKGKLAIELDNREQKGPLQKFVTEVSSYQQQVNKEIQIFQLNTNKEIEIWKSQNDALLQRYQVDLNANLNDFNRENVIYQAGMQKLIQQSKLDDQNEMKKIELYKADVNRYQISINKEVQQYQENYKKDFNLWQTKRNTDLQEYQLDIQNRLNEFNKENAQYESQVKKALGDAEFEGSKEDREIQIYQAKLQSYQAEVNKEIQEYTQNYTTDYTLWQTRRTTDIQKYQADIQNSLNSFNEANTEYQAKLQTNLQDASLEDAKENRDIQLYQANLQAYQASVNEEVQEYTQNYTKDYSIWQAGRQSDIAKYQADIQNNLNLFNKLNVEYKAKLETNLQDAQLKESKEGRDLQRYQSEITIYTAEVNKEIQRWTSEVFTPTYNEWKDEYQFRLAEYGSNIEQESKRVRASIDTYAAEVGKIIQQYTAETGYDISLYQNEIQASVQTFNSDLQKQTTSFTNNLQKYTAEVQKISSDNQAKIADFGGKVQDYSARLNKANLDYEWMQGRYIALKREYDDAFIMMGGQQQQQKKGRRE